MIVRLPGRGGLEVDDRGAGVPMIVIQTALDADELRPLAAALAEAGPYRVVHYLRRGYGGSAALTRPTTIADEVADLEALCRALSLGPVHLIGASFSAAVALSAASASPDTVRTLTVMEPPPLGVPSESEFIAACQRLLDARRRDGPQRALDDFMPLIAGPGWRVDMERERPGAAAALERVERDGFLRHPHVTYRPFAAANLCVAAGRRGFCDTVVTVGRGSARWSRYPRCGRSRRRPGSRR